MTDSIYVNPKQAAIDAMRALLLEYCSNPRLYAVEVSGSDKALEHFEKKISKNFQVPKISAPIKAGKIYVRVKTPANQYAGDIFAGHIDTEYVL